MNKKQIEIALYKQRNLAHQLVLSAEEMLVSLGLMEPEKRLYIPRKERELLDKIKAND